MSNKHNQDDLSLESILAEYKGDAYIEGRKKTPKADLDRKTEQILQETLGDLLKDTPRAVPRADDPVTDATIALPIVPLPDLGDLADTPYPVAEPTMPLPDLSELTEPEPAPAAPPIEAAEPTMQLPVVTPVDLAAPQPVTRPTAQAIPEQVVAPVRQRMEPGEVVTIPTKLPPPELEQVSFADDEKTNYAEQNRIEQFAARLEEVEGRFDDEYDDDEDEAGFFGGLFSRLFGGRRGRAEDEDYDPDEEPDSPEYEGRYDEEDLAADDMSTLQAAGKYGRGISGYQIRGVGTILLALLMLLFTGLGDGGSNLFWVMSSFRGLTATLLVLQILAMLLTVEVITTGLLDMFRRRLGVETLVTVAALASIADIIRILNVGYTGRTLPYAAVVAGALGMALLGIKSTRNAMKTSLRAAATGSNPYIVTSKLGEEHRDFTLFKAKGELEGFVRKTEQMDFSEYIYRLAAPLLIVASAVFALLAALGGAGEMWDALQYFAAMTVVSASFTGLLAYGVPYAMLSRKLAKVGAALAGWGGAQEMAEASGVIVTDQDVFPTGTMSLGGVKILAPEAKRQRVISATSSLIISAGSGLSELFADVLRKEELGLLPVENLTCYEGGGIGATVGGEELIVGSAGLMNLMGVRLPQDLNLKNAVFSSVNGELAGVFAINYAPQNSVMEALLNLLHTRLKPLFAVRDFNITPMMLQNKFHISTDKIDFLTYEERYALSDLTPDERAKPCAVLHRQGLRPLVDVIVGGKRLRSAVMRNTILSVASSVVGLVGLLSFFWVGAAETVSAVNLFYYLGAWLLVMCLMSRTVHLE